MRLAGLATCAVLAAMLAAPSEADAARCNGKKADIVRGAGNDVIKAPNHGPQVIVAGPGNDIIISKRNKDVVCAGPGDDRIMGGPGQDKLFGEDGNDTIDGGPGSDKIIDGGLGDDVILGGAGGDLQRGGDGNDRLFGEVQDDQMFGDAGNDQMAGGQGVDAIAGGPGDDWIRGDLNPDTYAGESGSDTLSYATATPPGPPGLGGVTVNLAAGTAFGDDAPERISGIENVVGSAFSDQITGAGGGFVRGNGGGDQCSGFATISCAPIAGGATPIALMADASSPDPGLILLGGPAGESWTVTKAGAVIQITGAPITPGPGCSGSGSSGVTCADPTTVLGYVLLYGGGGNDTLTAGGGFDQTTLIMGDGAAGDDTINGGPAADILFGGEQGSDRLFGNAGNDAVIGRGGGGDLLSGGSGTDQLVSDNPCDGHTYDGGSGRADVAGFAQVTAGGVRAKLSGSAVLRGRGNCSATKLSHGTEILEGTLQSDVLIGDNRPNLIIGKPGNDRLFGRGGRDELRGDAGRDRCFPGAGGAVRLSC